VEGDKQMGLVVMTEQEFYAKQGNQTRIILTLIGGIIAFFFSIGAMIGATITMNAQVAGRTREIGTLRALGFSRGSIIFSFLLESVVLALGGGILGAIASMGMMAIKLTMLNAGTWSEIVFGFEPTPGIIIGSLFLAVFMGLVGGFLPALRAARISPVEAMRG
jgi:putative ABC transport system permease protein